MMNLRRLALRAGCVLAALSTLICTGQRAPDAPTPNQLSALTRPEMRDRSTLTPAVLNDLDSGSVIIKGRDGSYVIFRGIDRVALESRAGRSPAHIVVEARLVHAANTKSIYFAPAKRAVSNKILAKPIDALSVLTSPCPTTVRP